MAVATIRPGDPCTNCHGHGTVIGASPTGVSSCWTCGGTGRTLPPPKPLVGPMHNHGTMRPRPKGRCPACDAQRDREQA